MEFYDLKLKNIELLIRYQSTMRRWSVKDRPYHIIGISLSGNELHDLGYQKFTIEENSIFFFNSRDDFSVHAYEMGHSCCIHFTTYEDITTDSFCIKANSIAPAMQLFEKMEQQRGHSFGGHHLAVSNFYRLCALFEEIRQTNYAPSDRRMLRAMEYLDLHFFEPECLRNVYQTCDLSRKRFDELFKKHFSTTPNRYITIQRIEYAKKLLAVSYLTIRDVSERCGFSDIYYFSKVFKTESHMTPSAFRKKVQAPHD